MSLTYNELRQFKVPKGSVVIWWLGQAGFIIKSAEGKLVVLDPYLSDTCGQMVKDLGLNFSRNFPAPIEPKELVNFDLYAITHSHEDHCDAATVKSYLQAGGKGKFLAPAETKNKLESLGVAAADIEMTWPNKEFVLGDLTFKATFAIPYSGDDLTHVGFIIKVADGPVIYFTGDTAYNEVIGISVAEHKPDVMFTVINGMWRNLSPSDAAMLAKIIQPKVIIPYHCDLFPDGQMHPHTLKLNLFVHQLHERFRTIEVGKPFVYSK